MQWGGRKGRLGFTCSGAGSREEHGKEPHTSDVKHFSSLHSGQHLHKAPVTPCSHLKDRLWQLACQRSWRSVFAVERVKSMRILFAGFNTYKYEFPCRRARQERQISFKASYMIFAVPSPWDRAYFIALSLWPCDIQWSCFHVTISTTALAAVNGLIFLNYRGTIVVELFTEIWTHILHVFFAIRVCGWDSFSVFSWFWENINVQDRIRPCFESTGISSNHIIKLCF